MKSEENFLFGLVAHTSLGVSALANHRGISPSPVGILTHLVRPQEFLMMKNQYHRSTAYPSCKCVINSNQSRPTSQGKRTTERFLKIKSECRFSENAPSREGLN